MKIGKTRGFTLIEVIVVSGLLIIISSLLITRLSSNKLDMGKIANSVVLDLRVIQSYALNTRQYNNTIRCGYGFHYINSQNYELYAGRDTASSNCKAPFRYSNETSTPGVEFRTLDPRVTFSGTLTDLFFLPPDPKLYSGSSTSPATNPRRITIRKASQASCNDPANCKYICVYASGRIEVYNYSSSCN